jgi:hypothetical protein
VTVFARVLEVTGESAAGDILPPPWGLARRRYTYCLRPMWLF